MPDPRGHEQQNHERAMSEVADVMVNLDHAVPGAAAVR